MKLRTLIPATAAVGAAAIGYATLIERNWFALRRFEIPVLPPGRGPLRVLHISDTHLTPGRKRLMSWIRSLDDLNPDLVVNTGDAIAHPQAIECLVDSLGPLLGARWRTRKSPDLPWEKLRDDMTAAGWLDLNNQRGRLTAGKLDIAFAGVHDSHIKRDRYEQVEGRADPAADLRIGVMHSPEPRLLDRFAADGYELLLAGHTHGGQLCLPFYGTLVTNCGIDRERARGLHRHPVDGQAWLHVSAGLGTSPWAPARFACRPEASLLTLVPRDSG